MFILQRKSDGLFYRNTTGQNRWCRGGKPAWISDLQDVKPFRTVASIKHSFNIGVAYIPSSIPFSETRECCRHREMCEHRKAKVQEQIQHFKDTYRILKVNLEIVGEISE